MPPHFATGICVIGIFGLFMLDRDPKDRTSRALWIPVVWLWIVGSREVSHWMAVLGVDRTGGLPSLEELEGNSVDRSVYSALLVLGVMVLFGRKRQVSRMLRQNVPILLFFLYCALSIIWSDYPEVAIKRWIKALTDVVMVMIILTESDRVAAIRRFVARVGFLLVPLSILMIKYYPELGIGYKRWAGTAVYYGVTINKNILGSICLLFGLGSMWCFAAAYHGLTGVRRARRMIAHGVFLCMVFWLFAKAHSMTSLACFLLFGGLMVATSLCRLARNPYVVQVGLAMLVAASFCVLFLGVGGGALEEMGKDPTLTGRTALWNLLLRIAANPLLGAGFESFWLPGWRRDLVWNAYWWHPNEAHNGYIEVYLNLGSIGVALLALIIATSYRNVILAVRRDPDLGPLRLAYFAIAVVYSFTEAGFRMMGLTWIFFLLAATIVPANAIRNRSERSGVNRLTPVAL